jgi:hypothetical protein
MKLADYIRADRDRRLYADELQAFIEDSGVGGETLAFWGGPLPEGDDLELVTSQLLRQYTSDNVLGQVCNDHVNAVLSKEPTWEIDPVDNETNEALTEWYKRQEVNELLQNALYTLLFARLEQDKKRKGQQCSSILRAYIPSRAVNDGRANFSDFREALLKGVRLMHPEPGSAGMLKDEDGETIGGYYAYREADPLTLAPTDYAEIVALDTEIGRQGWNFQDDHVPDENNPLTVIQIRSGLDLSTIESEIMYPLGGTLLMFEMNRRPFVTDSMIEQQKSHNANETYMNMGGGAMTFLERVFTNVQVPGRWETDEQGNKTFVPDPFAYGPNTMNMLKGLETRDANGNIHHATPGIHYHEPSGPGAFISTSEHRVRSIYKMANMLHLLIAGDATASGVARQQAAESFETSLSLTVTQAKSALEWILTVALKLGTYLSGGSYGEVMIDPRLNVRTTKPTPEEIRVVLELYKEGVISRAEVMRRVGIEDESAMLAQLEAEAVAEPEPVEEAVT